MRIISIILIFMVASYLQVKAQILDSLFQIAAQNNPTLKAKYADFQASMQRIDQNKALADPNLSFGYFISPIETKNGSQIAKIGLSQMFPWFGSLQKQSQITQLEADAKYLQFVFAKNELLYQLKTTYYPIIQINTELDLLSNQLDIVKSYEQITTKAFENGQKSMVDVLRVNVEIEQIETQIDILNKKKSHQLKQLKILLNSNEFDFPQINTKQNIKQLISPSKLDSSFKSHPLIAAYSKQIEASQVQQNLAKKQGLPNFGIGVDYIIIDHNSSSNNNGKDALMPMLNLSLPINRQKIKAIQQEAHFKEQALHHYQEAYTNHLLSQYETALYELDEAWQNLQLAQKQIEKNKQINRLLLVAYSQSNQSFEEVLQSQKTIIKQQIDQAKAVNNYHLALSKIYFLTATSL